MCRRRCRRRSACAGRRGRRHNRRKKRRHVVSKLAVSTRIRQSFQVIVVIQSSLNLFRHYRYDNRTAVPIGYDLIFQQLTFSKLMID